MKKPSFKKLKVHEDTRGKLVEIVRPEDVSTDGFGQITLTTAVPGAIKGMHYHMRKTEWYCVIEGKADLFLRNNKTGREKHVVLDDKALQLVTIPPQWYHEIKNIGKSEMHLVIYCDESFDKADPDTFYLK